MVNQKNRAIALMMLVRQRTRPDSPLISRTTSTAVCALAEADQRLRELRVRMHRYVTCDVVKDVGFGQVIQLIRSANGDRGREFAVPQTIEEQEGRYVSAYGSRCKSGQRTEETVDVVEPGNVFRIETQRANPCQKMIVRVFFPARTHALREAPPGFVIFRGVKLIRLLDVKFPAPASLSDKFCVMGG